MFSEQTSLDVASGEPAGSADVPQQRYTRGGCGVSGVPPRSWLAGGDEGKAVSLRTGLLGQLGLCQPPQGHQTPRPPLRWGFWPQPRGQCWSPSYPPSRGAKPWVTDGGDMCADARLATRSLALTCLPLHWFLGSIHPDMSWALTRCQAVTQVLCSGGVQTGMGETDTKTQPHILEFCAGDSHDLILSLPRLKDHRLCLCGRRQPGLIACQSQAWSCLCVPSCPVTMSTLPRGLLCLGASLWAACSVLEGASLVPT